MFICKKWRQVWIIWIQQKIAFLRTYLLENDGHRCDRIRRGACSVTSMDIRMYKSSLVTIIVDWKPTLQREVLIDQSTVQPRPLLKKITFFVSFIINEITILIRKLTTGDAVVSKRSLFRRFGLSDEFETVQSSGQLRLQNILGNK
jgi:hypothetical protein